jgi:hypothetical protein
MGVEQKGLPRFFAFPTGNINGLSMPGALASLGQVKSQWWFYVGLLSDELGENHSFELTFISSPAAILPIGVADLDFSFERAAPSGRALSFHATSSYGGESPGAQLESALNVLGALKVEASDGSFRLSMESLFERGPKAVVAYDAAASQSLPRSFSGYLGQPGACYRIEAAGRTFLWEYDGGNRPIPSLYNYDLNLITLDERGLVSEGWGAYVGADPRRESPEDSTSDISVEYAMPRLKVAEWRVRLEPASGSGPAYSFENSTGGGYLWLDRQALHAPESVAGPSTRPIVRGSSRIASAETLSGLIGAREGGLRPQGDISDFGRRLAGVLDARPAAKESSQLYCGCWLAINLSDGPYAGIAADFVAFWGEARRIANYDTDEGDATGGFMNLYLGILGEGEAYDPLSAYSIADVLNGGGSPSRSPYRLRFTSQISSREDVDDPERWAKTIEITIRGGSQARYAMAAYARRSGRAEASSIGEDLALRLSVASQHTITTPISEKISPPVFEGAAIVADGRGSIIGSAWVEQMVGAPSATARE